FANVLVASTWTWLETAPAAVFQARITLPGPKRPPFGGLRGVGAGGGAGETTLIVRGADQGPRLLAPSSAWTRQYQVPGVEERKSLTASEVGTHGSNQPASSASNVFVNCELGLTWRWYAAIPDASATSDQSKVTGLAEAVKVAPSAGA